MDTNVTAVQNLLAARAALGLNKYGTTTERQDIDLLGWLKHLQEELLDAAVYVERLKHEAALTELANMDRAMLPRVPCTYEERLSNPALPECVCPVCLDDFAARLPPC